MLPCASEMSQRDGQMSLTCFSSGSCTGLLQVCEILTRSEVSNNICVFPNESETPVSVVTLSTPGPRSVWCCAHPEGWGREYDPLCSLTIRGHLPSGTQIWTPLSSSDSMVTPFSFFFQNLILFCSFKNRPSDSTELDRINLGTL